MAGKSGVIANKGSLRCCAIIGPLLLAVGCNRESNNHSCGVTRGRCELGLQGVDIVDPGEMKMKRWDVDVSWIERGEEGVAI